MQSCKKNTAFGKKRIVILLIMDYNIPSKWYEYTFVLIIRL